MGFSCPDCGCPLLTDEVGGERVDGCHACGGVWFDAGELARVLPTASALARLERAYQADSAGDAGRGSGLCPRCGAALAWHGLKQAPSVKMRVCPGCRGVWAPDGALARLAAARGAGLPTSSASAAKGGPAESFHLSALGLLAAWAVPMVSVALFVALCDVEGRLLEAVGGAAAGWCYLCLGAAVVALVKPHTVTVTRQGLSLRSALFGWRVPWSSVRMAELHEPDEWEGHGDEAHMVERGRVESLDQLSLADLEPTGDWTPRRWSVSATTRLWIVSWRGFYSFGAEWRDHERLIIAIRRAMGRSHA